MILGVDREDEKKAAVEELRSKITKGKGEIIVCRREIEIIKHVGGAVGNQCNQHYQTQAGIISGRLRKYQPRNMLDDYIDCSMGIWTSSNPDAGHYQIVPNYVIPVEKRLETSGAFVFHMNFYPEELAKAQDGEIRIGDHELIPPIHHGLEGMYLKSLDILIGEEEIREFVGKEFIAGEIDDFFNLFKEGEIERQIEEHKYQKREGLIERLTQAVVRLYEVGENIDSVKEKVMAAKPYWERTDGGGSYIKWDNEDDVNYYSSLQREAKQRISKVEGLITEAERINLREHPALSGKHVGFPSEVKPELYIENTNSILEGIKTLTKKLNTHLREAEKAKRSNGS